MTKRCHHTISSVRFRDILIDVKLNISPNPCYSDRNKVFIGRINFGNGSGETQAINTTKSPSVKVEKTFNRRT